MTASALYCGRVHHARFTPKHHRLAYRIFMLLIDIDELGRLDQGLRLFSRNRFNLISFHDKDYGDGSGRPLRRQVEDQLAGAGIPPLAGGAIRMLCMPRVLGRAFNPLTLYFCHAPDGGVAAIIYEVSNTFGARNAYVLRAEASGETIGHGCAKSFFVSPFMDPDLHYAFDILPPGDQVRVAIQVSDTGQPVLTAGFGACRTVLSDPSLFGAWIRHPLQTVGVLAAIYWEGLKLLLRGLRWRPPPPGHTPSAHDHKRRQQGGLQHARN